MLNTNSSYVFSEKTLKQAIQEWVDVQSKNTSIKEESFLITKAALPWFMLHLKQTGPIYMFTYSDILREIDIWKSDQLANYPQQKKRIEETCDLLINFFISDVVRNYKMIIQT